MPANKNRSRNKGRGMCPVSCPKEADEDKQTSAEQCYEEQSLASHLLVAVAEQKVEAVADCIAKGADPNDTPVKACTPLLLAVKLGNLEIVKLLLQSGALCHDRAEDGMTLLHHAAVRGAADIALHLCEVRGAVLDKCNQAGCTPLYQAVQHGHVDCVRTFLDLKANLEARTRSGATPLYIASDRGNLELVNVLLLAGCDKNVRTACQMTPLLVAAFNGHSDVLRTLLADNVDIEQRGPCGGTPLYVAAQEGRQHVAELLLERGAKVDAVCDGQLTPSLIAAMQGHAELLRVLLKAGADLAVRTEKGSTLAIMASRHGRLDSLKVLIEVGGAKLLDGQSSEGLSALGASKAGRHKETTAYIESVIAAQKAADLSAWEASLPGILEELVEPSKEHTKSKTKRKGKVSAKCASEPRQRVPAAVPPISDEADEAHAFCEEEPADVLGKSVSSVGSSAGEEAGAVYVAPNFQADDGAWMQVGRRGAARTARLAQAEASIQTRKHASGIGNLVEEILLEKKEAEACILPSRLDTPPPTPIGKQPLACAPILAGPVTPSSAQSGPRSSPFGFRTVFPLWPPTPDAFFEGLPPAALDVDASIMTFPGTEPAGQFIMPTWPFVDVPFGEGHFAPPEISSELMDFLGTSTSNFSYENALKFESSMITQAGPTVPIRSMSVQPGAECCGTSTMLLD